MDYLDTSVLIALLTAEPTSEDIERWMKARPQGEFLLSDWTMTEMASALSRKLRKNEITEPARSMAQREFSLLMESMTVVHVGRAEFYAGARLVERHDLGLRASDALHLAVAQANSATLWTLDRRLLGAGLNLGLSTASPLSP